MGNEQKLVVAFTIFVVLAAVFVAISEGVQTLPIESVPTQLVPVTSVIVQFFSYAPIAFAVAWLRNLLGFFRNWLKARGTDEEVEFELKRYFDTVAYYIGPFTVILASIPAPYNAVGAALIFVIDVFTSEWKKIQA